MLKKIALGALATGLVAVLVVGAVNRTNAVSGDANGTAGRHGQAAYVETEPLAQGGGGRWSTTQETTGRGGQGAGYVETEPLAQGNGGRRSAAGQETTGRGGRWAQESAEGQTWGGAGNSVPQADVLPSEWNTLQGTAVSVADDLVEIQTADGTVIPFEGQPLRFAIAEGFSAEVGDEISLNGYEEDGEFKIGVVTNLSSDATYTLRDTSGRPGWSGGRRG